MTLNRRNLLKGELAVPPPVPRPPWTARLDACTGCGQCAEACPQAILAIEQGLPRIRFSAECTFCGACAEACPQPVFDTAQRPFRHAVAIADGCLPLQGVTCGSCADACPEAAIRFRPRLGGAALPALDATLCTGCGACLTVCPVDAIAIHMGEAADA